MLLSYKDSKQGTWYASFYFENWQGVKQKKLKRGFATKKDALAWEREFLLQQAADLTMTLEAFVEIYITDKKKRLRENTWSTKEHIIRTKILPYFKEKRLSDIKPRDVIAWQNEMLNYQRLKGQDVITDPKTPKSVRVIQMPQFLTDEIRDYLKSLYKVQADQRIFEVTKSYLHHEMDRGAKEAGVKRIRIHDLRHSHVSLLIEMGFSALAIADRVGHESVDITYKYAHLFPSKQQEMAQKLDMERREG